MEGCVSVQQRRSHHVFKPSENGEVSPLQARRGKEERTVSSPEPELGLSMCSTSHDITVLSSALKLATSASHDITVLSSALKLATSASHDITVLSSALKLTSSASHDITVLSSVPSWLECLFSVMVNDVSS